MSHEQDGREPTEPTDAELELVLDLYRAAKRLAGNKTLADVQAVIDATNEVPWSAMKRLSGARPMPDTPAPDEVGQLRAEVLRVTHAYEQVCMGIQKLRDAADLSTARVAELEALCRVTLGQGKTIVSDASINGIMGGAPTTLLIQVLDESHTIGDDATGFGRDNLEPGDGNVQIVFTKAESVDVVIDTLFKIKGEIESTPAAPDEVVRLRAEVVEQSATIARQFELLKGVANVLKGQAGETELWSHADLPEMATRLSARVAELEAALVSYIECGTGNSTDFDKQADAYRKAFNLFRILPAAPGKEPTSE